MAYEKPNIAVAAEVKAVKKVEEEASPEIREDMEMLASSLEELLTIDVSEVDDRIKRIEKHVDELRDKYRGKLKVGQRLEYIGHGLVGITTAAAVVIGIMNRSVETPGMIALGGLAASSITDIFRRGKIWEAKNLRNDILKLVDKTRELSDASLKKGGAQKNEVDQLIVTEGQIERARGEMDEDLKNKKPA